MRRDRRGGPRSAGTGVCKPGHLQLYSEDAGKLLRGLEQNFEPQGGPVRECPDRRPQAGHQLSIQGTPALLGYREWCGHCVAFRESVPPTLLIGTVTSAINSQGTSSHVPHPLRDRKWRRNGAMSFRDGDGMNCLQLAMATRKGSHPHSADQS